MWGEMYNCSIIFGRERAQKLWALMREASGSACPCEHGAECIFDWRDRDVAQPDSDCGARPGGQTRTIGR